MSYLDPKERVIDLKLTSYGKYLLSIGKLNPTYYGFFDDDVIYDGAYASITETQSEIEKRIQEETPKFSAQTVFSGRELEIFSKNPNIINDLIIGSDVEDEEKIAQGMVKIQDGPEHAEVLLQPLGTTNTAYEYAPAWNASFLKAPMSSSVDYLSISGTRGEQFLNIPQLNVDIKYSILRNSPFVTSEAEFEDEDLYDGEVAVAAAIATPDISETVYFESGASIEVKQDALILRLEESNAFFKRENFEIEFFEIQTVDSKEHLIPLKFYADEELFVSDSLKEKFEDGTAEQYFTFKVDEKIPSSDICPYIKEDKVNQIYQSKIIVCEDFVDDPESAMDRNLYLLEDEQEDICE